MLTYLLQVSLLLLLVWPVLALVLRYSGRFHYNRWLLLVATFAIFALPAAPIEGPFSLVENLLHGGEVSTQYVTPTVADQVYSGMVARGFTVPAPDPVTGLVEVKSVYNETGGPFLVIQSERPDFLSLLYLGGLGLLLGLLLFRLRGIWRAHRVSLPVGHDKFLRQLTTGKPENAYTFGRTVYLGEDVLSSPDLHHIIDHERVHARQLHTFDVMLGELCLAALWFHPVAWWLRARQRANLEFLVDAEVLRGGTDRRGYQLALLRFSQAIPAGVALPLPFSEPSLRSRIVAMRAIPRHWSVAMVGTLLLGGWLVFASGLVTEGGGFAGADKLPEAEQLKVVNTEGCAPCYYRDLYQKRITEPITSFHLFYQRLPRPAELDQIKGILWQMGDADLNIFSDCSNAPGEYAMQFVKGDQWVSLNNLRDNELFDLTFAMWLKPSDEDPTVMTPEFSFEGMIYPEEYDKDKQFAVYVNGKEINLSDLGDNPPSYATFIQNSDVAKPVDENIVLSEHQPSHFYGVMAEQPRVPANFRIKCNVPEMGEDYFRLGQARALATLNDVKLSDQPVPNAARKTNVRYFYNDAEVDETILDRHLTDPYEIVVMQPEADDDPRPRIVQIVDDREMNIKVN